MTSTYIQSIQTVEITIAAGATSGTATITSVTTTNAAMIFGGSTSAGTAGNTSFCNLVLTNGTTVTATRNTSDAINACVVRGTVVEFTSSAVVSVQHGTIAISSGTSGTKTITAVTTANSAVFYAGEITSTATAQSTATYTRVDLTNTTTVTATIGASGTTTVAFCVVQFQGAIIQSIQQRSKTLTSGNSSDTDTITSVTTANAWIAHGGSTSGVSAFASALYNVALTNATTVTLTRSGTSTTTKTINYTIIEFVSGILNSLQRNTTAVASVASADATITSVDTTVAFCNFIGFLSSATQTTEGLASAKLLNATTVRCQKNTAGTSTSTPSWEILEFAAATTTTGGFNQYYSRFIGRIDGEGGSV